MTTDQTYALEVGTAGHQRLDLQHDILKENSIKCLTQAGLKPGHVVWDIGCGNGAMLPFLAQTVGGQGHVYALDQRGGQLDLAKKRVQNAGLTNVIFFQGEIGMLRGLPAQAADLVHMRLLLMHVKNPRQIIRALLPLLKEGGVVVSQESIMSKSRDYMNDVSYHACIDALVNLGKALGVDYDIGGALATLYKEAGYKEVGVVFEKPEATPKQIKEMLIRGLEEWQREDLKKKVMS
ncbi:MAG: class I SAM-dependent methyltransferase [Alphaproteobacteria bacterium]|nr:class I SAM-dependent methyltransferase [Alphaproteobacteria bacterium]